MKFRKLEPSLRPAVESALRETGAFHAREIEICLEMADGFLEDPRKAGIDFEWGVDEREGPVGFVVYGDAPIAEQVWEVYWIAVPPPYQGRGFGRALLARAEEGMRKAGARMSLIETSGRPDYAPTNAFYQRCGYRESARLKEYYRAGDDLVIYRKDFEYGAGR